jgi:hypothetical protein
VAERLVQLRDSGTPVHNSFMNGAFHSTPVG